MHHQLVTAFDNINGFVSAQCLQYGSHHQPSQMSRLYVMQPETAESRRKGSQVRHISNSDTYCHLINYTMSR